MDEALTLMDDIIMMTVTECTAYLSRKLSGRAFPEASMVGDVVEHLVTVNVLENHVIMMLMHHHLAHATGVGRSGRALRMSFADADLLETACLAASAGRFVW